MNELIRRQIECNKDSRDIWTHAAAHRQMVTQLLNGSADGNQATLGVLGAGNCNDLDLKDLTEHFQEVHLIDLDGQAVQDAVARQGLQDNLQIQVHGDCDVTGMLNQFAKFTAESPPSPTEIESLIRDAATASLPTCGQPFYVSASVCLLSQLIESIVSAVGEHHEQFIQLVQAIRTRHLENLIEATQVGGRGILVTDIVSSDTAPELATLTTRALPAKLGQWIAAHNHFHGLNPGVLAATLQSEPRVAGRIDRVEYLPPWIWDFGARHYAVLAVRFRRTQ